ncbi:NAD(P)/FAD-dependent oxidoreductase [Desulfosediminicola flagellatus]|uniref:NAD(P)/FAD-dependent oxidoreductase n=1 Tax=Desulfosediminicola flagellatus TaxID=2569541 RepID=UPI0010AD6F45|nr:dehydrogenase [Desulfosediminicola flagellatus]
MDLILNNLRIPIENDGMAEYHKAASAELKIGEEQISIKKMLSKALDMRNFEQFYYKLSVVVRVPASYQNRKKFPEYIEPSIVERKKAAAGDRPIIIGFGPAGMFAALELIEHGIKPIIFERGKKIEERHVDVQEFIRKRKLNTESNIQFGEGGAGSYSDGKLFSRRNNNTTFVSRVLDTFIKFGAPKEIGYIAKPHLGTDVLCVIVRNIRNYILERGGEIHYSSKMTDILITNGKAHGVVINGEQEYLSTRIYLASGHSARDTYEMLHKKGVALEQKPIAVGVRIEHPTETIDLMRYGHKYHNYPGLGAATYSLNHTNREIKRGVYTFCMCPGGEVVNASSEDGLLVVNGMSYSQRSLPYSNAAMVVSCHTHDYPSADPLAGLEFQKEIERKAFISGGRDWKAPAQNLMSFLGEATEAGLHESSFQMGLVQADMKDIVPKFVSDELQVAFTKWKQEVPLFISDQAILLGVETRTSSPVKIARNDHYESENIENLYPLGEGSGYTGGITSSAADAIRAVAKHISARAEGAV